MPKRREPRWLTREQVEAIHGLQLEQHGGLPGVRDVGALESALGRPQNRWHYGAADDAAACAAAYGFALAKSHAFSDGNKRTAFVAMATFFERNGFTLSAPEPEAVITMLAVADGTMTEDALARWLRDNSQRRRRTAR
ncbi:MAG TPA: type II toxin-antitoxin system death-on-curing family toxin [Gemmatimonadaceae bacterium]|nr:type II toxin-antitoxin system death-on-curing family toxin [Gemmatimonadaceae bacterium]